MRIRLGCLLALLLFMLNCRGQVDLRIGPSAGTMVSRLPNKSAEAADIEAYIPHVEPRLGFLVGLNGRLTWHKNWSCVAALEYQNFGESIHGRYASIGPQQTLYHWEGLIDRRFHKLALPVLLGFRFGTGNVRPIIQAGFRTSCILKGTARRTRIEGWTLTFFNDENVFKYYDASRIRLQLLASLGMEVGENWYFGFQVANPWLFPATEYSWDRLNDFDVNFQVAFRPWSLGGKSGM